MVPFPRAFFSFGRLFCPDTGGGVRVAVADTGCGIPPERIATIFDDFVTTKRRGLGLGLALSKRILDQHGASVSVESDVGKGTRFTIVFPAMA